MRSRCSLIAGRAGLRLRAGGWPVFFELRRVSGLPACLLAGWCVALKTLHANVSRWWPRTSDTSIGTSQPECNTRDPRPSTETRVEVEIENPLAN